MRKLLIALLLVFVMVAPVMASELPSTDFGTNGTINAGLEVWTVGMFYNARGEQVLGDFQINVLDFKRLVGVQTGFITDAKSNPWTWAGYIDISTLANLCKLNYNVPGGLHLIVSVGREFNKSWREGGFWGWKLVQPF